MNTKLQLLIILIASIFFLSTSFTFHSNLSKQKGRSEVSNSRASKTAEGQASVVNYPDQANDPVSPVADKIPGFKGPNTEDDGVIHHFHLERVRQRRKHAGLFCCLAKIVIVLVHLAVLVCGYCHVLHH